MGEKWSGHTNVDIVLARKKQKIIGDKMDREEMLETLKSIKGTLLANYGCYDTGIEFYQLTSTGGAFVRGPGSWPINGPFDYSIQDREIGKLLLEIEYEGDELDEESLEEMIEEHEHDPLPKKMIKRILQMDGALPFSLMQLAAADCAPGRKYFIYSGDVSEATAWETEEEAIRAFLEEYSGDGQPWDEMDDDELEEYVDYLDDIEYPLDFEILMEGVEKSTEKEVLVNQPAPPTVPQADLNEFKSEEIKFFNWLQSTQSDDKVSDILQNIFKCVLIGNQKEIIKIITGEATSKVNLEAILITLFKGLISVEELIRNGVYNSVPNLLIAIRAVKEGIVASGWLKNAPHRTALMGKIGTASGMFPQFFLNEYFSIQELILQIFGFQVEYLVSGNYPIRETESSKTLLSVLNRVNIDILCLCVVDIDPSLEDLKDFLKENGYAKEIQIIVDGPGVNSRIHYKNGIIVGISKTLRTYSKLVGFEITEDL
jgi:hypothetical protein